MDQIIFELEPKLEFRLHSPELKSPTERIDTTVDSARTAKFHLPNMSQ